MEWLRSQSAGTSLIQYPWSTSTARKWCKKGLARSLGLVMQPAPAIHSAQYMVTAKKYARDIVSAVKPVPRGAGFATASDQPMRAVARNGKQLLSARPEVAPFRSTVVLKQYARCHSVLLTTARCLSLIPCRRRLPGGQGMLLPFHSHPTPSLLGCSVGDRMVRVLISCLVTCAIGSHRSIGSHRQRKDATKEKYTLDRPINTPKSLLISQPWTPTRVLPRDFLKARHGPFPPRLPGAVLMAKMSLPSKDARGESKRKL